MPVPGMPCQVRMADTTGALDGRPAARYQSGMTQRIRSSIRAARLASGLSQQSLARQAGISRQSYAAIESGGSVPATDVALRLAAALSTTVEALFHLPGAGPSWVEAAWAGPPASERSRVRTARVGATLFAFPLRSGVGRGVEPADGWGASVHEGRVRVELLPQRPPPCELVAVGCDPAFALVVDLMRRDRGMEILWHHQTSRAALEMLAAGQAHVVGVHLVDRDTGTFNEAWVRRLVPFPCTRIGFSVWAQEIVVAPSNPLRIGGIEDLVRPGVRFLNRQPGSGTRVLLDDRLRAAGLSPESILGYVETAASSHMGVAETVASGAADAGVGIRAAARAFGLTGIPLCEEQYDLVVPDHFLDLPAVGALLDLLRSRSLAAQVESLGGYDVAPMGRQR